MRRRLTSMWLACMKMAFCPQAPNEVPYHEITLAGDAGVHKLYVSDGHYIPTSTGMKRAETVEIGDMLWVMGQEGSGGE